MNMTQQVIFREANDDSHAQFSLLLSATLAVDTPPARSPPVPIPDAEFPRLWLTTRPSEGHRSATMQIQYFNRPGFSQRLFDGVLQTMGDPGRAARSASGRFIAHLARVLQHNEGWQIHDFRWFLVYAAEGRGMPVVGVRIEVRTPDLTVAPIHIVEPTFAPSTAVALIRLTG